MQLSRDAFELFLENTISPDQAVAKLFQQKVTAAIGHHQKIELGGKSLDLWFTGMPENSLEFLQALRLSDYVNQSSPEDSLLLKLFEFKGPMFGVLNESEIQLIKDWLIESKKITQGKLNKIKTTPILSEQTSAKKTR